MQVKKTGAIILSIVIVLLGAVLFIWPGETLNVLSWTIGIIALLAAGIGFFFTYKMRENKVNFALYLVGSIVVFAVGMVFLLDPEFVTALFPIIFGVVIMLNGALNIWQAVTLKKEEKNWLSHFLLAVLTFGLGIFIFANPFQTIQVLLKAIGVILMFDGISNIWTAAKIG